MRNKIVLGIDPGFKGASALVQGDEVIWVESCPVFTVKAGKRTKTMLDLPGIWGTVQRAKQEGASLAVLESVHAMPKQGVTSCFRFGAASMAWEMALVGNDLKRIMPAPQTWKKVMLRDIPGTDGKGRSILAAQRMFPNVCLLKTPRSKMPSSDFAEAILLACYGYRQGV